MNIYYQIAEELLEFHNLKKQLPNETIPIQIRENYKNNPNIADINYIQRKDRNIREAQEEADNQIYKTANASKINGNSFLKYRDSLIKQALTYLEYIQHSLELDAQVDIDNCVAVFDAVKLCDKTNNKQKEIVQQLYYLMIMSGDGQFDDVFTVTTLLTMISTIIVIPLQKSTNDEIQNYVLQYKETFDKFNKKELYTDILNLTSHHIYVKQKKMPFEYIQQLSSAEKELQYECTFRPQLISKNNDGMLNKHNQRVTECLQELNIQEKVAQTVVERQEQFNKLTLAKRQLKQQQQLQQQAEDYSFKPKLAYYNQGLYQKVIEKQKLKNSNLLADFDDEFLQQQLQTEQKQKSPQKQQSEEYTFQPKIGTVNKKIFEKVVLPRGFDKTVERQKKGQQDRFDTQHQIDNMGQYDPEKQLQLSKPIKQSVHEYNQNIRTEKHIQRREMLKQAEILLNNGAKKATVKFYMGDTIAEHMQKLIKLFQVKKNDELSVKQQLILHFGEFTTEAIAQRKRQEISNLQQQQLLQSSKYDPVYDSIGYPTTDKVFNSLQVNAAHHQLNTALSENKSIQQTQTGLLNTREVNYNDKKIQQKYYEAPDENGRIFRGSFGLVDQDDPVFM